MYIVMLEYKDYSSAEKDCMEAVEDMGGDPEIFKTKEEAEKEAQDAINRGNRIYNVDNTHTRRYYHMAYIFNCINALSMPINTEC